jgi:hypothetical protein
MSAGVVRYTTFLFTRNQRRDFTAFVRPHQMTNKEVSAIANAFNYVNDITPLTADAPALYCFPLGAYLYLLRHYNSGRRHAGRDIPVIEGIAIERNAENLLGVYLSEMVGNQYTLLDISGQAGDIETLERQVSAETEWVPEPDDDEPEDEPDFDAEQSDGPTPVDQLAARYANDWLLMPFNDEGRELLWEALSDERLPILHFAFGSNSDVVAQLKQSGIAFDIVAYAGVTQPVLRPRDAMKAVDVREILPPEAATPTNFVPSPHVPPEPSDLADGRTAPTKPGEPLTPEAERRERQHPRRKRSLLRKLLDALFGH